MFVAASVISWPWVRVGRSNASPRETHGSTTSGIRVITRPATAVGLVDVYISIIARSQPGSGVSSSSRKTSAPAPALAHSASARLRTAAIPGRGSTTYRTPRSRATGSPEPAGSLSTTRIEQRIGASGRAFSASTCCRTAVSAFVSRSGRWKVGITTTRSRGWSVVGGARGGGRGARSPGRGPGAGQRGCRRCGRRSAPDPFRGEPVCAGVERTRVIPPPSAQVGSSFGRVGPQRPHRVEQCASREVAIEQVHPARAHLRRECAIDLVGGHEDGAPEGERSQGGSRVVHEPVGQHDEFARRHHLDELLLRRRTAASSRARRAARSRRAAGARSPRPPACPRSGASGSGRWRMPRRTRRPGARPPCTA